ncbi:hypothetical protein ACFLQW_00625 [Candidatus Zixiibacteriota bacterium]
MSADSGYRLGITCCFCGGKLEVDEASHTIGCPHCASILKIARSSGIRKYVITGGLARHEVKFHIDRHLKKNKQPLATRWLELTRVYVPFWRVTGTVFSTTTPPTNAGFEVHDTDAYLMEEPTGIGVTITNRDVSFCADGDFNWGVESLGVRTQTLRLAPLEKEFYETNHLIPALLNLAQAKERFDQATAAAAITTADPGSEVKITTVGLEGSLIYFPVWVANFITAKGKQTARFDPLAKRVVALADGEAPIPSAKAAYSADTATLQIIPHRCPNCGQDLPESERSVTYYCGNCQRLFNEAADGYQQIRVFIPQSHNPDSMLFPFWIFDLRQSTWPGKDELMKAFKLVQYRPDLFYVPAFGVANPERLMRLVGHYNRRVYHFTFAELPNDKYSFADVTITPEQAACLIMPLTAAAVVIAGYQDHHTPPQGTIDIAEPDLIWLPYAPDRYFWREQITGATIEKAAVRC